MMKAERLAAALICAALIFCLLPAQTARAATGSVLVAGTEVVNGGATTYWTCDSSGGIVGGADESSYNVKYEPTLPVGTLTLREATIKGNDRCIFGAAIYCDALNIVLVRDNTVVGADNSSIPLGFLCGIFSSCGSEDATALSFSGTGSLSVTNGSKKDDEGTGILVLGSAANGVSLAIDGCSVSARANEGVQRSCGVCADEGRVVVSNGGELAGSGAAASDTTYSSSFGIDAGSIEVLGSDSRLMGTAQEARYISCGVSAKESAVVNGGYLLAVSEAAADGPKKTAVLTAQGESRYIDLSGSPTAMWRSSGSSAWQSSADYMSSTPGKYLEVTTDPFFTTQPVNRSITVGSAETATFTAEAIGTPAPAYQWQTSADGGASWGDVSAGGNASSYTTPAASDMSMNAYQYRCVATNGAGSATSAAATLSVSVPITASHPSITRGQAPENETIIVGNGVAGFSAATNFSSATLGQTSLQLGAVNGASGAHGSVSDGSIKIVLAKSYLDTLPAGVHTVSVALKGAGYANCSAVTTLTVLEPAPTASVSERANPATGV